MCHVAAVYAGVAALGVIVAMTSSGPKNLVSCNDGSAHLQNMTVRVSPEPIQPGDNVTIIVEGDLDKSLSGGVAMVEVRAGPISIPNMRIPFSSNHETGKEHIKVTIGPFIYPEINLRFIKAAIFNFEILDHDLEQVMCMHAFMPVSRSRAAEKMFLTSPIQDCSGEDDSYHMKNLNVVTDPLEPVKGDDVVFNTSFDTDKELNGGVVDATFDLTLTTLSLEIPFAFEPTLDPLDNFLLDVGPVHLPYIPILDSVRGDVRAVDQDGQNLMCVNLNLPVMVATVV